jgi:hypothetical protein
VQQQSNEAAETVAHYIKGNLENCVSFYFREYLDFLLFAISQRFCIFYGTENEKKYAFL